MMGLIAMTASPRRSRDDRRARRSSLTDMFARLAPEDSEPPSRPAQGPVGSGFRLRFPLLLLRPPALPAFLWAIVRFTFLPFLPLPLLALPFEALAGLAFATVAFGA